MIILLWCLQVNLQDYDHKFNHGAERHSQRSLLLKQVGGTKFHLAKVKHFQRTGSNIRNMYQQILFRPKFETAQGSAPCYYFEP